MADEKKKKSSEDWSQKVFFSSSLLMVVFVPFRSIDACLIFIVFQQVLSATKKKDVLL